MNDPAKGGMVSVIIAGLAEIIWALAEQQSSSMMWIIIIGGFAVALIFQLPGYLRAQNSGYEASEDEFE